MAGITRPLTPPNARSGAARTARRATPYWRKNGGYLLASTSLPRDGTGALSATFAGVCRLKADPS